MPIDEGKLYPGIEYQFEIITYTAVCLSENLLRNKQVEDFQIYTNQEIPGFDDIIVKVKYESEENPFVYLGQIQLYRKDKINFKSGKDRLQHYLEKVQGIKNIDMRQPFLTSLLEGVPEDNIEFWYISNSYLSNYGNDPSTDPLTNYIELDDSTRCYLELDTAYQSIFPVRNGVSCYKWITKDGQPLPSDLRKFYVFLRQPDHNQVADSIVDLYKNCISKSTADSIIDFVYKYLNTSADAELTKHIFETHLLKLRLSDFIVSPTEAFEIHPKLAEDWNKLVMEFDVTVTSSEMESYVFGCIWQEIRRLYPSFEFNWNQTLTNNNGIFEKTLIQNEFEQLVQDRGVRHYLYIPDTIMDLLIEMWKCDYLPLVLSASTDVNIINKYKHLGKRFVILHKKDGLFYNISDLGLRVFANVADIQEIQVTKEFLDSIHISLQGREPIGLYSILNDDRDLMNEIKCDQLLYLMRNRKNLQSPDEDESARIIHEDGDDFYVKMDQVVPIIGKCLTNTEKYIERRLRKPTIQESILDSKRQVICLLSGDLNSIVWCMKDYYKFLDGCIEDIVSRIELQIENKQSAFIGINDKDVEELWSLFSARKHPLLHIKVENDKMVLQKYRNCPDITSYVSYKGPTFKQESFFQETSTGITVLTGEPGSGKTTLLRSLFNACPKHCFALFCDLKNYEQDLRESNLDLFKNPISFILRKEEKQLRFLNFLDKFLEQTKELILFLDSFDEVLPECEEQILNFIRAVSNLNGRVIIASRLVTAHIIGKSFEVRLLKIDTLSEEDIQAYLNNEELSTAVFEQYPPEFRENPLHLNFMITLHRQYALPSVITPSSFYSAIIEKQIEHFYHDKQFTAEEYEYNRKQLLEIHQKLALMEIFGDTVTTKLDLDFEDLQKKCTYSGNLKSGLIVRFSDRRPIFVHRTIAEFLVAEWLIENINKDIGKRMYTMLFRGCRSHVRHLFDDILCKNLSLHQAVIQADLNLVKRLCSGDGDYLKEVDKLNRTALEVAASYCSEDEANDINYLILEEIVHHMTIKGFDLSERNPLTEMHWTDYLNSYVFVFGKLLPTMKIAHAIEMYCCYRNQIDRGFTWGIETGMLDTSMAMLKKNLDLLPIHFDKFLYEVIKEMRVDLLSELIELQNSNNMEFDILCRTCKNLLPASEVSACTNLKIEGGFTAVHIACMYGSVDVVKELVRLGVEVNAVDDFQLQPLYYAIGNGSIEIVTILVKLFKKEKYLTSSSSRRPRIFPMYVHNSLRKGYIEIAKILLDNDIDINETDEWDRTALHYAVEGHNRWRNCSCFPVVDIYSNTPEKTDISINEIILLLEYKADCNIQDNDGITPLHIAVKNGSLNVTETLLQHGATTNLKSKNNYTPLHHAVENKSNELVKLLLQYGADVNLEDKQGDTVLLLTRYYYNRCDIVETLVDAGANVNHQNKRGETILHITARRGDLATSEVLLRRGANPKLKCNLYENTPLHYAAERGKNDIVKLLLEYGADVNSLNENGETALFSMIGYPETYYDIIETFLNAGANVNHQDNKGETVLHITARRGDLATIEVLLRRGANLNLKCKYLNTPLHLGAGSGKNDVVKLLLEEGADVNSLNKDGETPLFSIVGYPEAYYDIVETLLNAGANINHQNKKGETVLHKAVWFGDQEKVGIFLDCGADANIETSIGNTALMVATQTNNHKFTSVLLEKGVEINHQNKYGNTALHDAVHNYYIQICKKIRYIDDSLKYKASSNINEFLLDALRDNDELLLTLWPNLEILKMLLTGGVDNRSEIADISLRRAADILKLLIDSGADVNAVNKEGLTALGLSNKYKTPSRNYCKKSNLFNKYPNLFKEANE